MSSYKPPKISNLGGNNPEPGVFATPIPAVSPVMAVVGMYVAIVNRTFFYNVTPDGGGNVCNPIDGCEYGRFV